MPAVPQEELEAMITDESQAKLAPKEEIMAEERVVLETVFAVTDVETGVSLEQKGPG
jgi:hypothetical protein